MGTVSLPLEISAARYDPTNTPEYAYIAGTNFPVDGYAFPQTSARAIYVKTGPVLYGNAGNWTFDIHWESRAGSTAGTVQWTLAVAAITPGDAQNIETKAFATSQNVSSVVNTTGKGLTLSSATLSNLDNANVGDTVWIKITRTDTSMVGDAIIQQCFLSYSDGQTGTAGSGDVVGPASATTTAVAIYNGTTGKLVQNSAVLIDPSGNLTGVGTINGNALGTGNVVGPASATSGRVAVYNGTTGKLIQDGTKLETDLVTGPASATIGRIATFSGTSGKTIQDGGVLGASLVAGPASSVVGNIPTFSNTSGNAVADSGVSATAHATRHNPGGADTLFAGTWAANDAPVWSGTIWVPKLNARVSVASDFTIGTTISDVTGTTVAISRTGRYEVRVSCFFTCSATGTNQVGVGLNYSGAATMHAEGYAYFAVTSGLFTNLSAFATTMATTVNTGSQSLPTTPLGIMATYRIVVTATGNLVLRCIRVAGGPTTILLKAGSAVLVSETS